MTDLVRITEVSLRDGLQNEPAPVPTVRKAALARLLADTGVDEIELSSFVSPKWIPQLGDAADLFLSLAPEAHDWPLLSALVPNEKGMQAALDVNARAGWPIVGKVAVFTAASETFAQRNTNASIAETLERFKPVIALARDASLPVRGYISCAFSCPFEGPVPADAVARVARALVQLGVNEIDLGDTIGAAAPASTRTLLDAVITELGPTWKAPERLTLHLHDTFGAAADCARAALDWGLRSFDASAGGLGGCPYASRPGHRAPGNLATDRLDHVIREAGLQSSIQPHRLAEASALARTLVSAPGESSA